MKYILDVANADEFFKKVEKNKMFSGEKSVSGLSLKYNGVFTLVANPKINLVKKNDTQIEIHILSGWLMPVIAAAFTLFFWALGITAIVTAKLNIPVIILVFLLPSLLWILQAVFNKVINKQMIDLLKNIE